MKHYNPSITERANRIFNLKNGDSMSEEIDGPVATISINPSVRIVRGTTTAAGATIITLPADKDFYLTSARLSYAKTAADTGTSIRITVVIDGVTQAIVRRQGITLTADTGDAAADYSVGMKLDRGSAISLTVTGTYTAADAIICGYFEEVTRT